MAAAHDQAAAAARALENDRRATRATIQVEAEIVNAIVLDADEEEAALVSILKTPTIAFRRQALPASQVLRQQAAQAEAQRNRWPE